MVLNAAEVILFGIQAGVRLYDQARQAYVERTRERELVLPLPGIKHQETITLAFAYFKATKEGKFHLQKSKRLAELHEMAKAGEAAFKANQPEDAEEYLELYKYYKSSDSGMKDKDIALLTNDIVALNKISQWREGDTPHPSAIRRIAGTLTEIGIDYFASGPGTRHLAGNSPARLVISELLVTLDNESFVSQELDSILENVFISTLSIIEENPEIISGDPKAKVFISGVAGGVVEDIQKRIDKLNEQGALFSRNGFSDAASAVFRSVVRNSAETVLAKPETFLGLDEDGEKAMASKLGQIVLDAVLPEDSNGMNLSAIATGETLDQLVRGILVVVSEHPELMSIDNPDVEKMVQDISKELSGTIKPMGPDLFPEIARLVLEKTAENLETFWKADDQVENLAVTALKSLMVELAKPVEDGKWKPQLSKAQVLAVSEEILDDLAENPQLLTRMVDGKPALTAAIENILTSLAEQKLDSLDRKSVV